MKRNILNAISVVVCVLLSTFSGVAQSGSGSGVSSGASVVVLPVANDVRIVTSIAQARRARRSVADAPPAPNASKAIAQRGASEPVFFATEAPKGKFSNADVVRMKEEGQPEQVIIGLISYYGAENEFDLSPGAREKLKASGVSDAVIGGMGSAGSNSKDPSSRKSFGPQVVSGTTGFSELGEADSVAFVRELSERPGRFLPIEEGLSAKFLDSKTQSLKALAANTKVARTINDLASKILMGFLLPPAQGELISYLIVTFSPIPLPSMEELLKAVGDEVKKLIGFNKFYRVSLAEGAASGFVSETNRPNFEVAIRNLTGDDGKLDLESYEPVIVRAAVTALDTRLFFSEHAVYPNLINKILGKPPKRKGILEERIRTEVVERRGAQIVIRPKSALKPGEYAVVLRSRTEEPTTVDRGGLWSFSVR